MRLPKKGSLLREVPVVIIAALIVSVVVKTFFIHFFFSPIQGPEDTEERARMDPEEAALRHQESYPDPSL